MISNRSFGIVLVCVFLWHRENYVFNNERLSDTGKTMFKIMIAALVR